MTARPRSLRDGQRRLSAAMRRDGGTWRQVADAFVRRWGYSYLQAFRLAHGLSQEEAARRYNARWNPQRPLTGKHISYWEMWPARTGKEPPLAKLKMLAAVYECTVSDLLVGIADHRAPGSAGHGRDTVPILRDPVGAPAARRPDPAAWQAPRPGAAALGYAQATVADQISELVTLAEATNIGDGTLEYLGEATVRLAHDCLTVPPAWSYERAANLAGRISAILRAGRQRIRQARDLYVIAGKVCAVLAWVSGDLGDLTAADVHARNGLALAGQAEHDGLAALLLSAQSKTAYWDERYRHAAIYARRAYEYNPPGSARVLLACQEADALQALGRVDEAREALDRAERVLDGISTADELGGIFACGIARQANYSIGTYLRARKPELALEQAQRADAAWRGGETWAFGTWAQVQAGAATARIMSGEIDGAMAVLQPVLSQPAERHLATLTTRLRREVIPLLQATPIRQCKTAVTLREQITDYCSAQHPIRSLPAGWQS